MTEADEGADEWFQVFASAASTVSTTANEGTNVCRIAALSARLGAEPEVTTQVAEPLTELGFSEVVLNPEYNWRQEDFLTSLEPFIPEDLDSVRLNSWMALNESGDPREAIRFIIAVLGSRLERESVAAAAALWRQIALSSNDWRADWLRFFPLWLAGPGNGLLASPPLDAVADTDRYSPSLRTEPLDGDRWQRLYFDELRLSRFSSEHWWGLAWIVRERLAHGLASADRIVRQLALAAFMPFMDEDMGSLRSSRSPQASSTDVPSTMIHGTWGWKGQWWRPGGAFHNYILQNCRPNLFSRGARFSWSGAYSRTQRQQAAEDFQDWSSQLAPNGLQTVFAHSYGGEVAALASLTTGAIQELALLSTPATPLVDSASCSSSSVIDVRLRFDPVLALAGTPQRLTKWPSVVSVIFNAWTLDHGATHDDDAWRRENVKSRAGL